LSLLVNMRAVGLVVGLLSQPVMGCSVSSTCFLSLHATTHERDGVSACVTGANLHS
jgi:hypothetical protein